jgi:hypothetical protein
MRADACGGFSFANVELAALLGFDFAHTKFGGCGVRVGAAHLLGELQRLHELPVMLSVGF